MQAPDPVVLREALRQGERILELQDATRESVLRRSAELLRLAVASVGGVIVVMGLLSTSAVEIGPVAFIGFVAGVSVQIGSIAVLAASMAGGRIVGAFAYGPDLRVVAEHLVDDGIDERRLLETLVQGQPVWIDDNSALLIRLQRMNACAVAWLSGGAGIVLLDLFFILGGHIVA